MASTGGMRALLSQADFFLTPHKATGEATNESHVASHTVVLHIGEAGKEGKRLRGGAYVALPRNRDY